MLTSALGNLGGRTASTYLSPWEPSWAPDAFCRARPFNHRVYWANRSVSAGTALPVVPDPAQRQHVCLGGRSRLKGNIPRFRTRRGTLGYWTGEHSLARGYMRDSDRSDSAATLHRLDISRVEGPPALPENMPSRGLLEKTASNTRASPKLSANRRSLGRTPCAFMRSCGATDGAKPRGVENLPRHRYEYEKARHRCPGLCLS